MRQIAVLLCLLFLALGCVQDKPVEEEGAGGGITPIEEVPPDDDDEEEEVPTEPVEPTEPGDPVDVDDYLDISTEVGGSVDSQKSSQNLLRVRSLVNTDTADRCDTNKNRNANDRFSDQISYYVEMMLENTPARVGVIGSYYGTSSSDSNYFPNSLMSHPMCTVTSSTLSQTINRVPSQAVIDKLNRFVGQMNSLRTKARTGDSGAKKEIHKKWTKFFSCLAYTESLTTADTTTSRNVASKYAPSGYSKPSGVKFYEDPAQNEASRLNIGLFQFTPTSSGNINPCLRAWNDVHSGIASCQVATNGNRDSMIRLVGSSYQSFNAFCGVHKVVQTFAIQVNTSKTSATHPSNLVSGRLKASGERCVSLHFQAGRAYNHFGPFQNTTGSNLNGLFSCLEN